MKNIITFLKKEIVLTISGILAIASCFLVHPDSKYAAYIDWHTILILFCLMAVMAGFKDIGLFQYTGETLLKKIKSVTGAGRVLCWAMSIAANPGLPCIAVNRISRGRSMPFKWSWDMLCLSERKKLLQRIFFADCL